jgi:hypothetical protein
VRKIPDKPWDYMGLSFNPSITYRDVLSDPDKPWDYMGLSLNPNITYRDVLSDPDKPWDYYSLSCRLIIPTLPDQEEFATRWIAACRIQRHWKRAISDPQMSMCQKRLLREYVSLNK